jgi:hypothetical protein
MANFNLQDALGINYQNTSTKDKLAVVYKEILKNLAAKADYVDLINKNYSDNPVKGGSVHIDRLAFPTVRNYGTANTNGVGDSLLNNGIDILINNDKEIVVEIPKKDARLWRGDNEAEMLAANLDNMVTALQIYLDDYYFVQLQTVASTYDTSSFSDADALKQKAKRILALIQKLESVTGDNVNKIDRSLMVLTLCSADYDDLESYMTTQPNPAGNSVKMFHRVEVKNALRQDVDAVIQVRGSLALPMVLDQYSVYKPNYKNSLVQEMFISHGAGAVMPELIFKAAISTDNNLSI